MNFLDISESYHPTASGQADGYYPVFTAAARAPAARHVGPGSSGVEDGPMQRRRWGGATRRRLTGKFLIALPTLRETGESGTVIWPPVAG